MDNTDKRLLNLLQREFPVEPRPYAALGERLGIEEREVISRIEALRNEGYVRRLGASLNPRKLGYTSTLVAARVPEELLEKTAEYINSYPQVTHNYERSGEFNIWFTIIARDENEIASIIDSIRENTGVEELINLPATHVFKIRVGFDLQEE